MKELTVNNLRMVKQIMQQYRDLSLNGNKFFYYSYGKLDMKIQSILKEKEISNEDAEQVEMFVPLSINIDYEELKTLLGVDRIEKRTTNNLKKSIKENSTFNIYVEEDGVSEDRTMFIYDEIIFDNYNRKVMVDFNSKVIDLFIAIRNLPYANIIFTDMLHVENKYQINLYLYAITLLRGNKGSIQISVENIRSILGDESQIDDYNFITRFVNKPANEITVNKEISIDINTSRVGDNILINVSKNKENSNG